MQNPFSTNAGMYPTQQGPPSPNGPAFNSMSPIGGPPQSMPIFNSMGSQASFPGGMPPGYFQSNLSSMPGAVPNNMSWAPAQMPPTASQRSVSPQTGSQIWQTKGRIQSPPEQAGPPLPGNAALAERLALAQSSNKELEYLYNDMTADGWSMYERKNFSAVTKAGLADVDWRVPRVNYCKDPKYDCEIPPQIAPNVIQAKAKDGTILEHELGDEAVDMWAEKLAAAGLEPPPPEIVLRPGAPFLEIHKSYGREDDTWEMALEIRPLEDAMTGDLTQPLPPPIISPSDFENFHEGRYLKDDCPIA